MRIKSLLIIVAMAGFIISCVQQKEKNSNVNQTDKMEMKIAKEKFGTTPDGATVTRYILENKNEVQVGILDYGATIQSIIVPDKTGNMTDVTLGFNNVEGYAGDSPYFGCVVGRYANRIAEGQFTLDGQEYQLAKNDGPNSLHGGEEGFNKKLFTAKEVTVDGAPGIALTYISPDGEENYPGTLTLTVTYSLTDDNELRLDYEATTDKPTILNVTNHAYFNLKDGGKSDILDHVLMLNADSITPTDENLIPTGEILNIENTPLDFNEPKSIGQNIEEDYMLINIAGGFDHNYIINRKAGDSLVFTAKVTEPTTGRTMEVYTTEPAVQLYTGNFLDGTITGKDGTVYEHRSGLCLETQHYPDSPNHPDFPSTVLNPDEKYESTTIYKFGVEE
ncbi:MAG: aldose epimerase family protein [Bacteroidota bacterium]